jgi:cobaltochelatase CobN
MSYVFAQDNETVLDVASAPIEQDDVLEVPHDLEVLNATDEEPVIAESNNGINIHVNHYYNENSKTWDEDGYNLAGATVNLYDSSNNLVKTLVTDNGGNAIFRNLDSKKYHVEISYSTYEPIRSGNFDFTSQSGTVKAEFNFIPDILLLVDYNSHNEKVDELMSMSKRVAFISTTDYDKSREWLAKYANFIHVDMFAEGSNVFTAEVLAKLLAASPANANYNVAYTFGVYDSRILNGTGIHIVGANSNNNTYNTIENTYVGSYFQAKDINESDILHTNMINYLKYVNYLINPSKYSDPTLDVANAPLMSPECGFYHPDLGIFSLVPEGSLINQWIHENPGYNHDGEGSLNWMTDNYNQWVEEVLDPTELFRQFEGNYTSKFNPDKKFIAIATYYYGGDVVDSLIRGYEANGRPAFNIFKFSTQPSMSSILNKINKISKVGISSITSLYSWSLSYANGSAEPDLSEMDLAVLKGVNEISEYSYNSELGPQVEWTYAVTYPSFEGVYGPVILSYVDGSGVVHTIQSGIDKMVKLSCGWADLRDMNNSDKKIAIVLYNYPPGKAEIGASYLDVFLSTYELIIKLAEQGYDIGCDVSELMSLDNFTDLVFKMGNKGSWASGLLEEYVETNWDSLMAHNQLISIKDFFQLTSDIKPELYDEMMERWGQQGTLGEIMVYKNQYIVIPGLWFGNVFVTFQPSRGWEEVQNYHDLKLPPHQQYVSFYKWMDKTFKANAIINMGTHGTLEWLPGTNLGSLEGDWTFELTLTPTIYPYIVSNPGEAMVARDRISSLMITHMTPAMVSTELYGNYSILNDYINRYKEQMTLNVTSNAEYYASEIIKLAPSLGFRNMSAGENFTTWLDELHVYLEGMSDDFNTYGLHNIGKVLTGYELIQETAAIVSSQTKVYNQILAYLYPDLAGKDYFKDISGNVNYLDVSHSVKEFLLLYVEYLVNGSSVEQLNQMFNIPKNSSLYASTEFAEKVIVNIQNNNEWNALFAALGGEYVAPGLFADPAYSDSIPTGYDGYSSDPTRMPSHAAYESATKIVDLLLANYYEQHGKWPELTSLILWGTEISRTEGIGVAEFLYFLGCKPTWVSDSNDKVTGVEMLPLENLTVTLSNGTVVNRPRIDVFASIVTSNKDWINWMLTAINMAAFAEGENETNNYVIKHYAENPSLDRLFGLPGNILEGTGMSNLIPSTSDWNISTVNSYAADVYLNKVSYSWTIDEKGNIVIKKERANFEYLLDNVDLVTQNFDSTWRLFDSDDYYDWFGGLYNAARMKKQQSGKEDPDTAFVDIRNKNNYISRTYQEELEFEIRSMVINPQYFESLINTPAGMNSWASRMQNMYASTVLGGHGMNTELGNQMADTALSINSGVGKASLAPGIQSSMAWLIYMNNQGLWNGDPGKVQQLVDNYIQSVIDYGVACCHHTCKNLAFNMELIQMSSLTPAQKQKFAEILAQATNTDPLYQMEQDVDNNVNQGDSNGKSSGNNNKNDGNQNANTLANGTSQEKSDGSNDGGHTSAGEDASQAGNARSASELSSSQDASSSSGGSDSGAKAYELSDKSASKSVSATESSMPIFVIIAVIALIGIFLVGYVRDNKDDYDDY